MKYKLKVDQDRVGRGVTEDQGRGSIREGVFDQDVTYAWMLPVVETRVIFLEEKKHDYDVIRSLSTMPAYGSRLKAIC